MRAGTRPGGTMTFTRDALIQALRTLQSQQVQTIEPHLAIAKVDPRWFGSDIFPCDGGGLPSIDPGPDGSCRISAPDGNDGLHLHARGALYEIHLDRYDARRYPIEHVTDGTVIGAGALLGVVIGAALGGGKGALLGLGLGGLAGASVASRVRKWFVVAADGDVRAVVDAEREMIALREAGYAR